MKKRTFIGRKAEQFKDFMFDKHGNKIYAGDYALGNSGCVYLVVQLRMSYGESNESHLSALIIGNEHNGFKYPSVSYLEKLEMMQH